MSHKRSLILVVDGFGIGAMEDAPIYRAVDYKANTLKSLLTKMTFTELPNLTALGLKELYLTGVIQPPLLGLKSKLDYPGADSFFGHQEINGSVLPTPKTQILVEVIDVLESTLKEHHYQVDRYTFDNKQVLIINKAVVIADNIETDYGQVINVNASFDLITYQEELKIGTIVRDLVNLSRVIVLGAHNVTLDDFCNNLVVLPDRRIGVNTPASKVYNDSYLCKHMGVRVNSLEQLPFVLDTNNIPSYLVGKYGDLIKNPFPQNSFNIANTEEIIVKSLALIDSSVDQTCLIGINIQETDLAGHSMNLDRYIKVIKQVDYLVGQITKRLNSTDLLIVCADHGNDPLIGHTNHTREYVPVLIYNQKIRNHLTVLNSATLNNIGQTAATWLGCALHNGVNLIKNTLT